MRALCIGVAVLLAASAPAAAPPHAQEQPARFKGGVSLIEVDVIVTDRDGRPVRNLTKDDFQILEDGKPQEIAAFTMVDIPVTRVEGARDAAPVEADVATNAEEFDGRVFVLVLDDLQTQAANSTRVRAAARRFVQHYVADNDLVAVVPTGPDRSRSQDLTSSKARVLSIVDDFTGQKLQSATRLIVEEDQRQRMLPPEFRNPPFDTAEAMRAQRARASLAVLEATAGWLGRIRGRRKALVYFGEGIDYDVRETIKPIGPDSVGASGIARDVRAVNAAVHDLMASATRAGVSIYAIDPRGLSTGAEEEIAIAGALDPTSKVPETRIGGRGVAAFGDELQRAQESLRTISASTGGLAFVNRSEFASAFERIVEDNSTYYLLGYYEVKAPRPGQYPRLEVRMRRRDLTVRARRGYLAPARGGAVRVPDTMSPAMRAALESPIAVSGLGLAVYAAPFRGHTRDASVALVIEVAAPRLQFVEQDGRFETNIELALTPIDARTHQAKFTLLDNVGLRLMPETHAQVARHGVRLTRRLLLPPGRYRIAIGARETNGGAVGTVFADVDVPDFPAAALQMSGIALASETSTSQIRTVTEEPGVTDVLPGSATAVRDFAATDTLSLFAEIYANQPQTHHRIAVRTTVTAADGRDVFTALDQRRTQEAANFGLTHLLKVPLARFPPGRYVLRVEARQLLEKERVGGVTARAVEFRVR